MTTFPALYAVPVQGASARVFRGDPIQLCPLPQTLILDSGEMIHGVWDTHAQLQNQTLVDLFRYCKDPLTGYYSYLDHIKAPGLPPAAHTQVLVCTPTGNGVLDLSRKTPRIVPFGTTPWVWSNSTALCHWVTRCLSTLTLEDIFRLLDIYQIQAGGDAVAIRSAWNDPDSNNGKLLRRVFGNLPPADIRLHAEGLFANIAKERLALKHAINH